MIEARLNELPFFLPESWEEVKYNQYTQIAGAQQDAGLTGMEKAAKIISILTHIPLATIQEAGISLITELFKHLEFLQSEPEAKPITQVTVNNTTYYAQKLSKFGELVAFDKADSSFTDNPVEKLPFILAILLRKGIEIDAKPTKKRVFQKIFGKNEAEKQPEMMYEAFQDDNNWLKKRADLFDFSLNPVQVMGLAAFFLSNAQQSQAITQHYLAKEALITKLKENFQAISATNTDGKPLFRIYKKILLSTGSYLIQTLERY